MGQFPRPRVVVSACLEFEKVRYNGQVVPCELVKKLVPYVDMDRDKDYMRKTVVELF